MNEVRLKQSPGMKENDLSGSKGYQTKSLMNQKHDDIDSGWKKKITKIEMTVRITTNLQ